MDMGKLVPRSLKIALIIVPFIDPNVLLAFIGRMLLKHGLIYT